MIQASQDSNLNVIRHNFVSETFDSNLPSLSNFELSENEVHIWHASLDQPWSRLQQFYKTFNVEEKNRASRYLLPKDCGRFIVCRGILRRLLGDFLRIDPAWIQFRYSASGKPALAGIADEEMIHFNLAYSHHQVVFVFTLGHQIGVDIEYVQEIPARDRIAQKFFSENENAIFHSLPEHQKTKAFFNCWTRKEAFIKAISDNHSYSPDTFDVSLAPGEPVRLLRLEADSREASQWAIQPLTLAANYTGAFAVRTNNYRLKVYNEEQNEWRCNESSGYMLAA